MSNRIWTDEAIEILEKYYPTRTKAEMEELLPQYTARQINRRAKYMGLRKKKEVKVRSRLEASLNARTDLWSDEEKSIIIEHYPQEGAAGVQFRLPVYRSQERIKAMANRMGVIKEDRGSQFWKVVENSVYEEDGHVVVDVKIQGGLRNGNEDTE